MREGFAEWLNSLPEGRMAVPAAGFRPKVTVAVADEGMPPGQQWVVRGGDWPCVAHVPADKWVVVHSQLDPAPQLDGS